MGETALGFVVSFSVVSSFHMFAPYHFCNTHS